MLFDPVMEAIGFCLGASRSPFSITAFLLLPLSIIVSGIEI